MCLGSSPSAPAENKPVEYLHNSLLDGATINGTGTTQGRNSLRIDLAAPTGSGVAPAPVSPTFDPPQRNIQPLLPSPGMVVPTIGGSLAGTLPVALPGSSSSTRSAGTFGLATR